MGASSNMWFSDQLIRRVKSYVSASYEDL